MAKNKFKKKNVKQIDPQQSIESVLTAEIDIASKVTAAKEKAEKKIQAAQNNLSSLKLKIVEDARTEREKMIAEGIKAAHDMAEKAVACANTEAEKFLKNGRLYISEAENYVMSFLLGQNEEKR